MCGLESAEERGTECAVIINRDATEGWASGCICTIPVCSDAAPLCSVCKVGDAEPPASLRQISWHHFSACATIQRARPPAGPWRMQDLASSAWRIALCSSPWLARSMHHGHTGMRQLSARAG